MVVEVSAVVVETYYFGETSFPKLMDFFLIIGLSGPMQEKNDDFWKKYSAASRIFSFETLMKELNPFFGRGGRGGNHFQIQRNSTVAVIFQDISKWGSQNHLFQLNVFGTKSVCFGIAEAERVKKKDTRKLKKSFIWNQNQFLIRFTYFSLVIAAYQYFFLISITLFEIKEWIPSKSG